LCQVFWISSRRRVHSAGVFASELSAKLERRTVGAELAGEFCRRLRRRAPVSSRALPARPVPARKPGSSIRPAPNRGQDIVSDSENGATSKPPLKRMPVTRFGRFDHQAAFSRYSSHRPIYEKHHRGPKSYGDRQGRQMGCRRVGQRSGHPPQGTTSRIGFPLLTTSGIRRNWQTSKTACERFMRARQPHRRPASRAASASGGSGKKAVDHRALG